MYNFFPLIVYTICIFSERPTIRGRGRGLVRGRGRGGPRGRGRGPPMRY